MSEKNSNQQNNKPQMNFLDHLEALRWHLVRSVVAVITLAIALFVYHDFVFDSIILAPKNKDFFTYRAFCRFSELLHLGDAMCFQVTEVKLINTELSGQFTMHMWVSFVGGIVVASPYIIWEFWLFVKPALKPKEVRGARIFMFFASILFIIGVLFSYYIIVPLTVSFFTGYQVSVDVINMPTLDSYISTITTLTLLTGLVFELPILIFFLSRFGIITPAFMRKYRKHAIVVILIAAAIITPSSDILTQVVVALPMYVLYELSIFVSVFVINKQNQ